MDTSNYTLNVYITHFTPPKKRRTDWIKYFITSRANVGYLRSWARVIKHGTRGNQPWKKDVMTSVRAKDYKNRYKYLSEVLENDLKDFKEGNSSSKIKKVKNQSNWMSSEQLRKFDKEKLNSVMKLKSFYTDDNKNAADFLDKLGD